MQINAPRGGHRGTLIRVSQMDFLTNAPQPVPETVEQCSPSIQSSVVWQILSTKQINKSFNDTIPWPTRSQQIGNSHSATESEIDGKPIQETIKRKTKLIIFVNHNWWHGLAVMETSILTQYNALSAHSIQSFIHKHNRRYDTFNKDIRMTFLLPLYPVSHFYKSFSSVKYLNIIIWPVSNSPKQDWRTRQETD